MPMKSFLAGATIALVVTITASSADQFDALAGMNAQPLDSSELGSITAAHWVTVNRNKPTYEIVLDEPPRGFEAYEHGAIYEERGPRTFYCNHSFDPCRAWSEYWETDTPPNKR